MAAAVAAAAGSAGTALLTNALWGNKTQGGQSVITNPGDVSYLKKILDDMNANNSPDAINKLVQGIFASGRSSGMPSILGGANTAGVRGMSSTGAGELENNLMNQLTGTATAAIQKQQENIATASARLAEATKTNTVVNTPTTGGGCFITTVVCTGMGMSDDCDELKTLREWRDTVLAKTENGRKLIVYYKRTAPQLSCVLETSKAADMYLPMLFTTFIKPAVKFAKQGMDAECFILYSMLLDSVVGIVAREG